MPYEYGKRTRYLLGRFYFHFSFVFYILGALLNKTIIPLTRVGYEIIIANSALGATLPVLPSHIQRALVVELLSR